MRHLPLATLCLALASASASAAAAGGELTPQGFSGVIATPDASVVHEGHVASSYSRLRLPRFGETDNLVLTFGLLPFVEIGGRFAHRDERVLSDMSGSLKLRLPLSIAERHLPDLAFGLQELPSAAPHFRSTYFVATEALGPLRLSVGYGLGPDRMNGVFAGAELRPLPWLRLLADHDASWTSVGAGLDVAVRLANTPVRLGAVLWERADGDDRELDFALSADVPLGVDRHSPLDDEDGLGPPAVHGYEELEPTPAVPGAESLEAVADALVGAGFQNVRVGVKAGRAAYVELEDNRFHWNELDGLGVALGIVATRAPTELDWIVLVQRKTGLALRELWAPRWPLRDFLRGAAPAGRLETEIDVSPCLSPTDDVVFVGGRRNAGYGKLQIGLGLRTQTFIADEMSPFGYVLSLKPEVTLPAWQGGAINAAWEIPFAWSAQYGDNGSYQEERQSAHTAHALLYQGVPLAPGLVGLLGAGLFRRDKGGVLGEVAWSSQGGMVWLRAHGGYFRDRLGGELRSGLVSARVWVPWLDASLEATGGRYLYGDVGGAFELARYFGDTELGVYYRRTDVQIAGIRVALPLTPRRGMRPGWVQVRGPTRWRYDHTTTVNQDRINWNPKSGVLPQTSYTARDIYLNAGRLGTDYVRAHLGRMRQAYLRWGREEPGAAR